MRKVTTLVVCDGCRRVAPLVGVLPPHPADYVAEMNVQVDVCDECAPEYQRRAYEMLWARIRQIRAAGGSDDPRDAALVRYVEETP